MSVMTGSITAWVVRDGRGRMVLACWGEDAEQEAWTWIGRGYRVQKTRRDVLIGS